MNNDRTTLITANTKLIVNTTDDPAAAACGSSLAVAAKKLFSLAEKIETNTAIPIAPATC